MSSSESLDPKAVRLQGLENVFRGPHDNFGPYEIPGVGRVEVRFGVPSAEGELGIERFDFTVIETVRPGIEKVLSYKVFPDGRIERALDLNFVAEVAFPEDSEIIAFEAEKEALEWKEGVEQAFDDLFGKIREMMV